MGVLLSIVPRSITKTRAPFCAIMEQWQGCAVFLGSEKEQRYVLCKSLAILRREPCTKEIYGMGII